MDELFLASDPLGQSCSDALIEQKLEVSKNVRFCVVILSKFCGISRYKPNIALLEGLWAKDTVEQSKATRGKYLLVARIRWRYDMFGKARCIIRFHERLR